MCNAFFMPLISLSGQNCMFALKIAHIFVKMLLFFGFFKRSSYNFWRFLAALAAQDSLNLKIIKQISFIYDSARLDLQSCGIKNFEQFIFHFKSKANCRIANPAERVQKELFITCDESEALLLKQYRV